MIYNLILELCSLFSLARHLISRHVKIQSQNTSEFRNSNMITRIPLRISSVRLLGRTARDPTKAIKLIAGTLVASVWIQIIRQYWFFPGRIL